MAPTTDPDDPFFDIVAGIEIEDGIAQNFAGMKNDELIALYPQTKNSLIRRRVALNPQTDEDKDMQARYYGMLQEIDRRKLRPR